VHCSKGAERSCPFGRFLPNELAAPPGAAFFSCFHAPDGSLPNGVHPARKEASRPVWLRSAPPPDPAADASGASNVFRFDDVTQNGGYISLDRGFAAVAHPRGARFPRASGDRLRPPGAVSRADRTPARSKRSAQSRFWRHFGQNLRFAGLEEHWYEANGLDCLQVAVSGGAGFRRSRLTP